MIKWCLQYLNLMTAAEEYYSNSHGKRVKFYTYVPNIQTQTINLRRENTDICSSDMEVLAP